MCSSDLKDASPEDGRSFHIGLTKKGWAVKSDFEEISDMLIRKVYGDMPREDQEYLVNLLSQIEHNMI